MSLEAPEKEADEAPSALALIDCDVHPHFPNGLHSLAPYMSRSWQRQLGIHDGRAGWTSTLPNTGFQMPKPPYNSFHGSIRMDAVPEDGSTPASRADLVAATLFDGLGIDRAILLCGNAFGLGGIPNGRIAATIASATNEWLHHDWYEVDDRFRAAILVSPQDPLAAAEEIRRVADRTSVAEIMFSCDNRLMGDPAFYPIYDAAQETGLPIAVHPTGTEGAWALGPSIGGVPWHHIEYHTCLSLPHQANAVSLVAHGVFERFPDLRIVFTEVGLVWLLEVMWRMDKNWKGLRDEVPWVKRRPSEYMREHFRFTTQPLIEPDDRRHLEYLIEMLDCGEMLMFSTDYPHWDADDPRTVLNALPEPIRPAVAAGNAMALYGDRLS